MSYTPESAQYAAILDRVAPAVKYTPPESAEQVEDAESHPLARIIEPGARVEPPHWLLPGFMAEGLTLIAGQHGVGKTTALLPLAAGVAGVHETGWPLAPKHWRHVVYVTEDASQALRILHGLAGHLGMTVEAISERLHLVEACRLPAGDLVQVGATYVKRYGRTAQGVELLPLVVLDTQAATIELESENDNSEASGATAALKQRFEGLPVWLVSHIAKANLNRSDVQNLSARGASAWEADANATAFLVKEGDGPLATRWLVLGKRRFEPRWPELLLAGHWCDVEALDVWGEPERVTLRWAVAEPSEGTRVEIADKARQDQQREADGQLRDEVRAAVRVAHQQGNPLNRAGVKAQIRRKASDVVACIERLIHEGWLIEVHVPRNVRAHPSRADFLVDITTAEREAMQRGEPLAPEKQAVPDAWRRPNPPAPDLEAGAMKNATDLTP